MSEIEVCQDELPIVQAWVKKDNAIDSVWWAEKEAGKMEDKEQAKAYVKEHQDALDKAIDACDREELIVLLSLDWFDEEAMDYYLEKRADTQSCIEGFIDMCLRNKKFLKLYVRHMGINVKSDLGVALVNDKLFKGKFDEEDED